MKKWLTTGFGEGAITGPVIKQMPQMGARMSMFGEQEEK
jgi:hypothetical protein